MYNIFQKPFLGSLVGRGRGLIKNALNMGVRHDNNTGRSDCVYKRDADDTCPGEDILFHYYTLRYAKVKLYIIIIIGTVDNNIILQHYYNSPHECVSCDYLYGISERLYNHK